MKSKPKKKISTTRRSDSWSNPYTRLGRGRNKVDDFVPFHCPPLDANVCAILFENDDFAKRAIKTLVEDAMRRGFSFCDETDEADQADAKAVNDACKKWDLGAKISEADIWGRCFGGGFIHLGVVGAGKPDESLDDDEIGEGGLVSLDVYDRRDVIPYAYYRDPLSPRLGEPSHYTIQPISPVGAPAITAVHETRFIRFGGVLTTRRTRIENAGWDLSVLDAVFQVLQTSALNWRSISALMADFAQGVFKIKDLIKILAQNERGVLEDRMQLMDQTRSSERAILLDADREDFERKATPVAGAADLLDRTWQRLAAAFEMPVTKLMGISPAGLQSTGKGEQDDWDDRVEEHQTKIITPRLERAGKICARSEGVTVTDGLGIDFPPIRRPTPAEDAEIKLKDAQRVGIYIDKGIVLPSEAAVSMFGKGEYSSEITIDLAARKAMLAQEKAQSLEPPPAPQQLPPGFIPGDTQP